MGTMTLYPGELRDELVAAGIPLNATAWPTPTVIFKGHRIEPDGERGCLVIDGRRCYSAAWLS